MKSRYLLVLLAITACINQSFAKEDSRTEQHEGGRKTPLSDSMCYNCLQSNGTCCGAGCCPAGSLCCQSAYSFATSCCDASLYQCGVDGACEPIDHYNPLPTSSNFYNWQVMLFVMWVTIMLCAGVCRICVQNHRRRAMIQINQPDNGAVIVVRPNERAPLLMFPQGGQPGRITAAKKGLTTRQIMAIPSRMYTQQDFLKEGADVDCVICMCEYKEGDLIRILLCGHHYHAQCIDKWFLENSVCCLCKMDHSHL